MFSTLLISPFILAMVSAQMTTTAPAAVQVTTTALAAAVQTTATTPPAPGSPTANSPAAGSAAADNSAAISSINTTDACGPKIPDPTVPDSCDTPVFQASGPSAYGVQCLNDTQTSTPVNITSCADLIQELCSNQWQRPGQWLWLTANGCSVGSFLPPTTFVGAAPWPTAAQCEELIYASMVDECQYSGVAWNVAAVNLKTLPQDLGGNTGSAVNVGYGSYIVSTRQQRTLSDDPNCKYVPRDDYCRGPGCFAPSYYQSKFSKPTPCYALGSLAPSFTPL